MKPYIPLEKPDSASRNVKLFIDLSQSEKLHLIDRYYERMIALHEDQTASLEDLLDTIKALTNMLLWMLRVQEMEKLGWDTSRRDNVFFATLEMRDASVSDEQSDEIFSLADQYLTPAKKARKQGKLGEAERLTNIFNRRVKWLTQGQEIL